jgi:hypothetical protein
LKVGVIGVEKENGRDEEKLRGWLKCGDLRAAHTHNQRARNRGKDKKKEGLVTLDQPQVVIFRIMAKSRRNHARIGIALLGFINKLVNRSPCDINSVRITDQLDTPCLAIIFFFFKKIFTLRA